MRLDKAPILFKNAALEFDKLANSVLEQYDLTAAQYKVLKYLYEECDNGVRVVDLEKYYSMSHPTIIGILQNLEKKGMIKYKENPENARSRFIMPSDKAFEQRKELEDVGVRLEKEMTSKLNDKERKQLIILLQKMMELR